MVIDLAILSSATRVESSGCTADVRRMMAIPELAGSFLTRSAIFCFLDV